MLIDIITLFPEMFAGGNVTVALKATEQQSRRAAHDSSVVAASIRNACGNVTLHPAVALRRYDNSEQSPRPYEMHAHF